MNHNLLKRRADMLDASLRGIHPAVIVDQLAQNYRISVQCLWSDWERRSDWAPVLLGMEKCAAFVQKVESKLNLVEKAAWSIYTHTDNPNAKVGALKVIIDSLKARGELVISKDFVARLERLEESVEKGKRGK
jgi:hypothetical protein